MAAHQSDRPGKEYRCDTCNISMWSEDYWQRHVNGRKHQNKVKASTKGKQPVSTPSGAPAARPAQPTKKRRTTDTDPSSEPTAKKAKTKTTTITQPDERYCEVCDTYVKKAKHNWSRHIKCRKHRTHLRDSWTTPDEAEADPDVDPVVEAGFAVAGADARPGRHFLIEFDTPIKYKLARQVSRRMFSCIDCGIRFRNPSHLQRHMQSNVELHRHLRGEQETLDQEIMTIRLRAQQLTLGATDEDAILIPDEEGDVSDIPPISMDQCVDDFEKLNVLRYLIREELLLQKSFIDKIAMCDEFTAAALPHSHSHVYLVTTEKHLFKEIKQFFLEEFHLEIKDIQRPRDLIKACRYITKNDRQAIIYNVPMKHASTTWRAHLYAQTHKQINWGHDIPASIAPCDRAVFTDVVTEEHRQREEENIMLRTDKDLLGWQQQLLDITRVPESDRLVFWVVDVVGHGGKSFMSQYLVRNGSGIIFNNFNHKDNAYLYDGEPVVVFDIPRDTPLEECSLQILEDLKNGYIVSQKYEVRRKVFPVPLTVVFSNSFPVKEKLSLDRWRVYNLLLLDEDRWILERDMAYNLP